MSSEPGVRLHHHRRRGRRTDHDPNRRKTIMPRTAAQADYSAPADQNDTHLCARPGRHRQDLPGRGQAVSQLITGSVQRLILSRPAVEAGERLGFLPGDMKEKVDPYCARCTMRFTIAAAEQSIVACER